MTEHAIADIVVATDGSDPANEAVETALGLASELDATLHPIAVVNPFVTGQRVTDLKHHREEANARVEAVANRARTVGIDVEPAVREGNPHEEILAHVDETDADLIVMGTHGRGGARRLLLGSVAERTIRTADVPILTVHGDGDGRDWGPESRLLLATDGSDAAVPAERAGVDLAAALGAQLTAISVVDEAGALAGSSGGTLTPDVIESVRSALEERASETIQRVLDRATAAGVDATGEIVNAEPGRGILAEARETDADMIVVGTHGRGGIRRVVLGSIAERVIRSAKRPVLVVPAEMGDLAEEAE